MIQIADNITLIGVAKIAGMVGVVSIKCPCRDEIVMGQLGIPIQCPNCRKVWLVSANLKMEIREVISSTVRQAFDQFDK